MQPTERWLTIDGLRMHLLDWGAGNPRTIVYFPVYTGNGHDAGEFAALIAGRYRFIAVDARGHGESDWGPPGQYVPSRYLADALAVLDALNLGKVVVMGSSFGAATAMLIGALHPDRAEAVIMDDQPPEYPSAASSTELVRTYERQKDQRFASLEEVVAWAHRARGRGWGWRIDDATARAWAEHAVRMLDGGTYAWRHDPEILNCLAPFAGRPENGRRQEFAAVRLPFLVARRRMEGATITDAMWAELQQLNPAAEFCTFEGAGHPVIFTQPAPLADAVCKFLG